MSIVLNKGTPPKPALYVVYRQTEDADICAEDFAVWSSRSWSKDGVVLTDVVAWIGPMPPLRLSNAAIEGLVQGFATGGYVSNKPSALQSMYGCTPNRPGVPQSAFFGNDPKTVTIESKCNE